MLLERWPALTNLKTKAVMAERLGQDKDFQHQPTLIHDLLKKLAPNDICRFYPKFHCEFSPIERLWAAHKTYCRNNCGYNITGLRKTVPLGLDFICAEQVRRFFGLCRRYEAAYRLAVKAELINEVVRLSRYTSHLRVNKTENIINRLKTLGPGQLVFLQ